MQGKKSDRPRLLKVSVATIQEKSTILPNCYKLRNSKNPTYIFATLDLTPLEQKKYKILRQKLAEMNKDNKIYKIKKQGNSAKGLSQAPCTDNLTSRKLIIINCQSLFSKKDSFSSLVSEHNPDFIIGTES